MKYPYFDAHCDTAVPVHYGKSSLRRNVYHLDLERLSAFSPCAQVFAVCVYGDATGAQQMEQAEAVFSTLLEELAANANLVRLCRSAGDLRTAAAEGKIGALLSMEGMDQLDCSLENLRRAYDRGLRIVHLTWNRDNALSGAALASGDGLTAQGRDFVNKAQAMGVVLDLSHLSDRGFWDVLEIAKKPVLAGHSNARALCDFPRNLTDEQFSALVKTGGVAGLNFCTDFLGLGRDVDAVVAHAEHWLSLGGEKAVCLGGDLDGIPELPLGMEGVQSLDRLYEAMLRRNWSEGLVRDIFYNNLMDFMERAL